MNDNDDAVPFDRAEVAERNLRILEALLFASAEPLAAADMAVYLGEGPMPRRCWRNWRAATPSAGSI